MVETNEAHDEVVKQLLTNLILGDETARRYAAEDLGYGQYQEGVSGLVAGLEDESIAVAEACADALVRVGGRNVAEAVTPALASENVRLRNLSAEVLSLLGEPAVPVLNEQLLSENRDVRKFAVDTLALIRSPKSVDALISALDDSDVNVAASAADGIGELGGEEHLDILEKYLDSDVWMKCSVIRGIGLLGGNQAYEVIAKAMREDDDMMVKVSCVQSLAHLHDIRSVSDLLNILLTQQVELFGNEVLNALEKVIQANPAIDFSDYVGEKSIEPLAGLANSSQKDVRLKAIRSLGYYKKENFIAPLVELFFSDDSETRKEAVKALINIQVSDLSLMEGVLNSDQSSTEAKAAAIHCIGQTNHENKYRLIRKFLTSSDPILPRVTLDALLSGLDPVPVAEIVSLLTQSDPQIRISAASAMGRLGDEAFIPPLIERLDDSNAEVVEEVDKALIEIGSANTNSLIRPYLNSFSATERKMAFEYFSAHNPELEKDKFIKGVSDSDPEVRSISFKVIENMGIATIELIEKGLQDSSELVRLQAARTLRAVPGSEEVVNFVKQNLAASTIERVKVEFAQVLGNLGEFGAVDLLTTFLKDSSVWVQIEAVESLRNIGDSVVAEDLKDLLESENEDLVEAVELALEELDF